jgi:hypothetical protein
MNFDIVRELFEKIRPVSSKALAVSKKRHDKVKDGSMWDQTHPTGFNLEDTDSESEESSKSLKGGKALLKQIYQPKLNTSLDYRDVISHLEEHKKEGVGDPKDTKQAKFLKQEIKKVNALHLIPANKVPKSDPLFTYSNPKIAQRRVIHFFGKGTVLYKSTKKNKKYQILDPNGNWVHFGQLPYEDFLKHQDPERRYRYLKRATNIKGDWAKNPYSPNWLAINILW